ncbi:uncharacterized protein BO72DRAFT_446 [Aspergillus fijiensis CBS 313.89]|uniref:Uncharacterized protein n=1 Tax=Aspergillus fijiensis CBS 313.89 TaxID=1448319 RepID=A0A8G1W3J4_9EURO|nr:uncharacterized protein BO72DRAFT_446 [Aspergillus fijiensis CBS 313.89]RAK82517.1 hypothetical protein BO72DRAFT_446 [Aspergillus fijiensis CBS 313.89]
MESTIPTFLPTSSFIHYSSLATFSLRRLSPLTSSLLSLLPPLPPPLLSFFAILISFLSIHTALLRLMSWMLIV